ncbi:protein CLAVATA 3 [Abrus precatorius]|uniref:Protein CLAVATA 3 n=1 Tax=Abrus precatorius TaxID=3816 RepID=A0A8B8KKN5_ABRPR|nr:protein CLAVATA 3 [Abrus precatorius]
MGSKLIFTSVVLLMLLLCLLLMRDSSDCSVSYECIGANAVDLKKIRNRKMLSALKDKKTTLNVSLQGSSSFKYGGEKSLSWELRKVPSGPDPLHHNGGNPKKPQTP